VRRGKHFFPMAGAGGIMLKHTREEGNETWETTLGKTLSKNNPHFNSFCRPALCGVPFATANLFRVQCNKLGQEGEAEHQICHVPKR
jgi:hypothetical protein